MKIAFTQLMSGVNYPFDEFGRCLDPNNNGECAPVLRNSQYLYGDFQLGYPGTYVITLDYAEFPDGSFAIWAVHWDESTKSTQYVEGCSYKYVERDDAAKSAFAMVEKCLDILYEKGVVHSERLTGQSPSFFARAISNQVQGLPPLIIDYVEVFDE